ncbi:MAG TPA: hypothetical protein VFQ78_09145, partial [Candidatus Udaeobacter sp.]|nr:hypothetical protein [Candidatus Udaeobacter sp.]
GTSNDPDIHLTLSNKGVGPAIIRRVIVKVDDRAVRKWDEAFDRMLGPGKHSFAESDMNGRVLAADESVTILTSWDANRNPLTFNRSNPLWIQMDENRKRIKVEICYCSTLGECWTLRAGGPTQGTTIETRQCPRLTATAFQQEPRVTLLLGELTQQES